MRLRITYLSFLFTSLLLYSCENKPPEFINGHKADLLGKYIIGGFNSIFYLQLKDDTTFHFSYENHQCIGGGKYEHVYGAYHIDKDSILTLSPKTMSFYEYKQSRKENMPYLLDSMDYLITDSSLRRLKYHILRWDEFIYLLSGEELPFYKQENKMDDFLRFSNYYNPGYEPDYHGSYFVKPHYDDKIDELNIKSIPKEYRNYFLTIPINANVIEIDDNQLAGYNIREDLKIYGVDKGSKDGVKENMIFYSEGDCCDIEILKVTENESYGVNKFCFPSDYQCQISEFVSTYDFNGR